MKKYQFNFYKRRLGDRYDGWRVRKIDPTFRLVPYVLRTRMDSQIFFEVRLPIDTIENFIKEQKANIPNLSFMHVIMASLVRVFSQRPFMNRFVIWNKIFARNTFSISLAIKRSLTDKGEESIVKPYFNLKDTLADVVQKVNTELENSQPVGQKNSQDKVSELLSILPDFLLRSVIFILFWLDKVGILPKSINKISPWHSSLFLTNVGSLGIDSIYHHLYEFGTCSMFVAMGKKHRETIIQKNGESIQQKTMLLKFVMDERVCDGFYYASSMRQLEQILAKPEVLLTPPEKVVADNGVGREANFL